MMDKVGILVFTSQEILEHKKMDGKYSENQRCYWTTKVHPKQLNNFKGEQRLYLAVDKQVKGYFIIDDVVRSIKIFHETYLLFDSESWTPIMNGEILKPFQGWRYYLHDEDKND